VEPVQRPPGRLVVRADASNTAGTGHLMRSLALAQAWIDRGGTATFALDEPAMPFRGPVEREGVRVVTIREPTGSEEDGAATARLADDEGAAWVVADGYGFEVGFQQAVRDGRRPLLVIDDDGRIGRYACDVVVDHNVDADPARYERSGDARTLLGGRFALLRREFRRLRGRREDIAGRARRLLITLGGTDHGDVASTLLDLAGRFDGRFVTTVVAGRGDRSGTQAPAGRTLHDVEDMAALMDRTDVAIATGGTTAWELAATGVPALLGRVAPNQDAVVRALARHDAAIDVGWFNGDIAAELEQLADDPDRRESMRSNGMRLVSREGADAVVAEMLRG
jgi:UDP-2,4-diacetamido-2,4,6-trideoxy-beta-L-altropyranose hydrolase